MKNLLSNGADYGYNGQYGPNQYGTYPGGVQGNNPVYNQQPITSPYYPNQLAGSNVQTQPYYSGQPVQPNVLSQPVVAGTPYPNSLSNVQPQPVVTPVVQPRSLQGYFSE